MRNNKLFILLGLLLFSVLLVVGCGVEDTGTNEPVNEPANEPANEQANEPADVTLDLADATYVGSETCSTCHSDAYKTWKETKHSKMLAEVTSQDQLLGDFDAEGNPFESEDVIALGLTKDDIKWTIGGAAADLGLWKQRYVIEDEEGKMKILPKEYKFETKEWVDYHGDNWQERDYRDLCISCHSTGYDAETKEFVEPGVGCESCHGPASNHVETLSADDIVNPANLDAKAGTDVCAQCHTRGKNADGSREDALGYLPGQNNLDDFYDHMAPEFIADEKRFWEDGASKSHHQQSLDFTQSKHYEAELTCATCHDPHDAGDQEMGQLKAPVDELCTSCHSDFETPINIDEFMPYRAKNGGDYDIRSHTFKLGQPSAKK